jgi:CIC family chloride channel protein
VIGMSAMLSAVTHAPLMAIVMVLEMTNQFQLTVPVMLACGVAHAISTQFGTQPMYGNPHRHAASCSGRPAHRGTSEPAPA